MSKLLLRGGCVLTMGVKTQNHAAADVLIDGETIAEIGQGLRARDAEVVDATDTIVMPGFVDTHRHACRALFRNLGASIPGSTPVSSASFGDHYTADDVYAATLIGLLGAVEAGITTVVDRFDARTEGGKAVGQTPGGAARDRRRHHGVFRGWPEERGTMDCEPGNLTEVSVEPVSAAEQLG